MGCLGQLPARHHPLAPRDHSRRPGLYRWAPQHGRFLAIDEDFLDRLIRDLEALKRDAYTLRNHLKTHTAITPPPRSYAHAQRHRAPDPKYSTCKRSLVRVRCRPPPAKSRRVDVSPLREGALGPLEPTPARSVRRKWLRAVSRRPGWPGGYGGRTGRSSPHPHIRQDARSRQRDDLRSAEVAVPQPSAAQ